MPIDLRSTEAFVRVVESGSMTAAAALGVTQPAVSQMMARLEANLGVPLFERGTRPLMLTPAGEELAARAPKLLTQGDQLQAAVRHAAHASRSVVRIGLIDSFASTAGPPLIRHLRKTAERLSIWSGISPTLGDDLLARKLDLVVSSDPMTKHRNIGRRRLLVEPFLLVLPKTMAAHIEPPRLEDLARNHPFVRYSVRSRIGAQIERHLESLRLRVPPSLEFDGTDPVFAMVAGGIGWAITTPLCLIHGRAMARALTAAPLPGPPLTRSLYLLFHKTQAGDLPARVAEAVEEVLEDLIAQNIAAMAPWVEEQMVVGK